MISIAVVSGKGGATKTTTNANMAMCLQKMGYKVLMCDIDRQSNLTINYGVHDENSPSVGDLMLHRTSLEGVIRNTGYEGLDIVPGVYDVTEKAQYAIEKGSEENLYNRLECMRSLNYDFILYDCPPSLDTMTMNALAVCDYVIVPVVVDANGIEGLRYIVNKVEDIRESVNPKLNLLGIFIAQDQTASSLHEEVKRSLKNDLGAKMMETSIPYSKLVPKATFQDAPVVSLYPNFNISKKFMALTEEMLEKTQR